MLLDHSIRIRLGILRSQALARVDDGLKPALTLSRRLVDEVADSDIDPAIAIVAHSTLLGQLSIAGLLTEAQQVGIATLAWLGSGHASPTNHISIHNNLAGIERRLGHQDSAIERRRQALELARSVYPSPHVQQANVAGNLGGDLALAGRFTEALELLREAEAMFELIFEQPNSRTVAVDNNLGWVLMMQELPDQALPYFERAIAAQVDHGYLNVLDHFSQFLTEHWPQRLPGALPTLLDDPRLQHAHERPQWQRILMRLDVEARQAPQPDADS